MPRSYKILPFHAIYNPARKLIRMSWDKNNLWALATKEGIRDPRNMKKSVFQQRWVAKREIRGYHVPNITEKQFLSRHFSGRIQLQTLPASERPRVPPVAALGFSELERRLDVVVFRCHFAENLFRARNIIVQGHVKVNGEFCNVPCRSLSDGDIITVDPDVVPTVKKNEDGQYDFNYVPYMAPHMFIPEYLEVNYPTCSAVFLRPPLPVADRVEIPSPHPPSLHQLAYDWYSTKKRHKTKVNDFNPTVVNGVTVRLKPKFQRIVAFDQKVRMLADQGKKYERKRIKRIVKRKVIKVRYKTKKSN